MSYHNRWIYILAGLLIQRACASSSFRFQMQMSAHSSRQNCPIMSINNPAPVLTDVHVGCCRSARCNSVVLLLILMSCSHWQQVCRWNLSVHCTFHCVYVPTFLFLEYTNPKILFPHRILSFFHPKATKSCWDDVFLLAKTQKQVRNLAPMFVLSWTQCFFFLKLVLG